MATDVSLTSGGVTFTFDNGSVKKIESTVVANTEQQELPISGPTGALLFDVNGAIKLITVDGILMQADTTRTSTGTVTTILSQKQWLESLINSNQTLVVFTSNYESQSVSGTSGASSPYKGGFTTTQGFVEQVRFTENEGDPNQIEFSLAFRVGN